MRKYEKLTKEDYILAKTEQKYLDKVYNANSALIGHVAKRYSPVGFITFQDIVDASSDGLIKAIMHFNPDSGYKFSTFAVICMQNSIRMLLRKTKSKDALLQESNISIDDYIRNNVKDNGITSIQETISDGSFEEAEENILRYRPNPFRIISLLNDVDRKYMVLFLKEYSYEDIAKNIKTTAKYARVKICTLKKIIKKLIYFSQNINSMTKHNVPEKEIAKRFGIYNLNVIDTFNAIHDYIFEDGPKPIVDIKLLLNNVHTIPEDYEIRR